MNNYNAWLSAPNTDRAVLIQLSYISSSSVPGTIYVSNKFITVGGIQYLPILSSDINLTEQIDLSGKANISYGDISITNPNGQYDTYLSSDYIWANKAVYVYYGPTNSSNISDYELVFRGSISDIDCKDSNTLAFKIRSWLDLANTTIIEDVVGNYKNSEIVPETTYINPQRNALKPVCFGEVFNIAPISSDQAQHEYMVHNDDVEAILEVRENGAPVAFNTNAQSALIPKGSFRLAIMPKGTITCSVQGNKRVVSSNGTVSETYSASADKVIISILNLYAGVSHNNIDFTSLVPLAQFNVGVYLTTKSNALAVCSSIAYSCGYALVATRLGNIAAIKLQVPNTSSNVIANSNIILKSLSISSRILPKAGIVFDYCTNYTVQESSGLATVLPQQHIDSYLISKTQVDAVAQNYAQLYSVPRHIIRLTGSRDLLYLKAGDSIQFSADLPRYNLANKYGLILSSIPSWITETITLEVLV